MTVKELLKITSMNIRKVRVADRDGEILETIDTFEYYKESIKSNKVSIYKYLNSEFVVISGAFHDILEIRL